MTQSEQGAVPAAELIGCGDGCGAAINLSEARVNRWEPIPQTKLWRCFPCQRQLAADNRYRAALGRAYGNRV